MPSSLLLRKLSSPTRALSKLSSKWKKALLQQHVQDLKVYRQAHQNIWNRILHWILIPIECWSALVIVDVCLLGPLWTSLISLGLGILSFWLCIMTTTTTRTTTTTTTTTTNRNSKSNNNNNSSSKTTKTTKTIKTTRFTLLDHAMTWMVAIMTLVFHIMIVYSIVSLWYLYSHSHHPLQQQHRRYHNHRIIAITAVAVVAWTLAWILQVCVGHWIWEGNQPNVMGNPQDVSYLAMCTSVLIAWRS